MSTRTTYTVILVSFVLLGGMALAQQTDLIALTDFPVPAWPEDGDVGPDTEDYVFVDLANNEFIVAYPASLEEEEGDEEEEAAEAEEEAADTEEEEEDEGPPPMRITHYDLLRDVQPALTTTVTDAGSGRYRYAYSVANGPGASQSIDQWALVLPEEGRNSTIQHPAGWFGVIQPDRSFRLKDSTWMPNGAGAIWSFELTENVIEPGTVGTGFELESGLRPGFTVGYFREAESTGAKVATSGYVPDVVKEQMDRILALEYNSRTILMIGPKFDGDADAKAIAEDYIQGIFTLARMGILDLGSDFVRTILNELTGVEPGSNRARLTATANSRVEIEVLSALKVSLDID